MSSDILDSLRQPEYTGENRCEPCTLLNLIIAAVLGSVIARRSKLGGLLAFGISVGLIALRGYLVPGTPELTKRYLPPAVLGWFGKEPEPTVHSGLGAIDPSPPQSAGETTASGTIPVSDERDDGADVDAASNGESDVDAGAGASDDADATDDGPVLTLTPETYFLEYEVVEPCEEIDDLCLTEAFETAWFDEIDAIDVEEISGEDAAAAFGFDPDDEFEVKAYNTARMLRRDGRRIGTWPSQAALVADVTAARVLESWDESWESYKPEERGQLLNSLRLFLETCPTTGGEVVLGEETVESCCQSQQVIAVTCEETGERLFEHSAEHLEA